MTEHTHHTIIIGAGPIGLELAVALKDAGVDYLHLEAGAIGQTITWYPKQVRYFSSPDRIAIAGVPLNTPDESKATREQYLAYLRGIVLEFDLPINTFERVTDIQRDGDAFMLTTQSLRGEHQYRTQHVVFAIGDMHKPRLLDIPGEDMGHVSHYFDEPHRYFQKKLLIVGGRNSAVEAALRCFRAGADVAISYRGDTFPDSVKYWIKPEIEWLIEQGEIAFYPNTTPTEITRAHVALDDNRTVDADFVLLLTGYLMDTTLLERAGVELAGENGAPQLDHDTMQTNVPRLYVAGTAAAGTQVRFKLFIENCHPHVVKISRALTGHDPRHINDLGYKRLHERPEQ
jgi:thioredoxin reductase (NADPH)